MSQIPPGAHPLESDSSTSAEEDSSLRHFRLTPENYRQLFEDAPDAMLACDPEGRIVDVNRQCLQMFGYQREELSGEKVEKLLPIRFRHSHESERHRYLASASSRAMKPGRDIWGLQKDGTELPVEISLSTVKTSAGTLVLSIIRDRTQRTLAAQELQSQAEFERTMAKLSAAFINLPAERVDGEITNGLQALAEVFGGDRSVTGFVDANSGGLLATHAWTRAGFPEYPKGLLHNVMPWLAQRLQMGEPLIANTPEDLPPEARSERAFMKSQGHKSSLVVPLRVGGKVVGALSCSSFREYQTWDAVKVWRFQAMADVLANAFMRKKADETLQSAYVEIQQLKDQLERENNYLRQEIKLEYGHKIVVGESAAMRAVLKKAEQVAGTDSTVLVLGETGTGKELIARIIHEMSRRNQRAMVKTNCAALPGTLIESELFGREKGAYTGALAREIGRFELADQSTIFLDEIGELPA